MGWPKWTRSTHLTRDSKIPYVEWWNWKPSKSWQNSQGKKIEIKRRMIKLKNIAYEKLELKIKLKINKTLRKELRTKTKIKRTRTEVEIPGIKRTKLYFLSTRETRRRNKRLTKANWWYIAQHSSTHVAPGEKRRDDASNDTAERYFFAIKRRYTRHPKCVGAFNAPECAKHMSSTF